MAVLKKAAKKTVAKKAAPKRAAKKATPKKSAPGKSALKKAAAKETAAKKSTPRTVDYLTKDIVIRAARKGFTTAATRTMEVMGENVIVRNGWVVRKRRDGSIERITRIARASNFKLD
jgi:hypothetical protein